MYVYLSHYYTLYFSARENKVNSSNNNDEIQKCIALKARRHENKKITRKRCKKNGRTSTINTRMEKQNETREKQIICVYGIYTFDLWNIYLN